METIDKICDENKQYKIYNVTDPEFKVFGNLLSGYDLTEIQKYAKENIKIPKEGNIYRPSNAELENFEVIKEIESDVYAGLPIEAGECAGQNSSFSAFEFHQGSEVNIVLTDIIMVLGKREQIINGYFNAQEDAELFFVPAGSIVEMYSTTLHYSPCKVDENGFEIIVILIKGSNESLKSNFKSRNNQVVKMNKFQMVHKSRKDKIEQGIKVGLSGELIKINPIL
ncbi:DUF4867 family protein [Carnobacterium sp. CS13]|uniref:DUF4867 family protein n=1 Tax=Carnobacterium sp. CS13 TaxID=2800128 RepID=UPI001913C83C|nr:DUF4867 family protein [Carnobacterium sp. CS13]QQP70063.1 DUF4867 family protein [Carnobacterium sp. CS13]